VDLRVDDHAKPLQELRRLYRVHTAYQHMNNGDLAMEKADMELAMKEYNAAMKMFPGNLEMQYWTAIALANTGKLDKALPMFKKIFASDKNWKELTRRLPAVNLLKVNETGLKKILAQ
jgi:tetratricopeptide (TPR) repeat protein